MSTVAFPHVSNGVFLPSALQNVAQAVPIPELDKEGFFPKDERAMGDAIAVNEGEDVLGITNSSHPVNEGANFDPRPPGIDTQISMLFTREIRNITRDVSSIGARFGLTIFLSTLVGIIFFKVGEEPRTIQTNLQSQFGGIVMILMSSMFGTAQPSLLAFPTERPVFLREYSTNHYSVASYFASRFTMEATITLAQILVQLTLVYNMISFQGTFWMFLVTTYSLAMASTALAVVLGCSVEDPKVAQEMVPILFVPQLLFAGFFVAPGLTPDWLGWARYLCTLTYAVRILLVEEFQDCADREVSEGIEHKKCFSMLDTVNAKEDETWWNWLILISLFVVFRGAALFILQRKATKFY